MANKQNKKPVPDRSVNASQAQASGFRLEIPSRPGLTPYLPGILLFILFFFICLFTYKDYGICWDEPLQRAPGVLSFDYIFNGSDELFNTATDNHGAGYELLLVIFERMMGLTDTRDIYFMRHLVTNILYVFSALAGYVLLIRLFKDRFVASLGFLMIVLAPRLYAHSFFNSKDIPFLSMILISLAYSQIAFSRNKPRTFLILGLLLGYSTSIRIMGVLLAGLLFGCLVIDLFTAMSRKEKLKTPGQNILFYLLGFVITLYLGWPYLWRSPINNFIDSFGAMAHFALWKGSVLLGGKFIPSAKLPWTYFPSWFLISNPELWLLLGLGGLIWVLIDFFKRPIEFFRNTNERNFLIYLICFFAPVIAVIVLHSVIYDDWRHLYFVYPPFVLLAAYFVNKLIQTKLRMAVQVLCLLEVVLTSAFMISAHPFNQVYFNYTVSHSEEYLRKNYEMDYWGCGYKQALEHLLATNPSGYIVVNCENTALLSNNIMILPAEERDRIKYADPEVANYFITNFRGHPYDYPGNKLDYSVKVLNSTVVAVYKQEKDPVKQKQIRQETIAELVRSIAQNPEDCYAHAQLGDAYFRDGQYDSAKTHHLRALQLDPTSVIINDLAGQYFGKQQYSQSIELCRKALEINPQDVNLYTNVGLLYMRTNQHDSAIAILHKALSIDPKYSSALINLAITYKTVGKMDSARKYEAEVQKIDPKYRLQ